MELNILTPTVYLALEFRQLEDKKHAQGHAQPSRGERCTVKRKLATLHGGGSWYRYKEQEATSNKKLLVTSASLLVTI